MRIDRLKLQNFKGFADFDKRLNRRFTLIVGENGTGKSTLLDALSVAFGSFLLGIPSARSRTIRRNEVREIVRDYNGSLDFVQAFPVVVEAEGTLAGNQSIGVESYLWRRELLSAKGRTTSKEAASIRFRAQALYNAMKEKRDVTLPLLSYYGTGRLWEEPRQFSKSTRPSPFDAYRNSHEARVSSADLLAWIERERLLELETEQRSKRLQAWKKAVESCFDKAVSVTYSPSRKRLEVSFSETQQVVSYDNLSHGQRNILSMVGDIAFKAIILNPHLDADAVHKTAGIVLIDEIDLHLHPRWQRKIIPSLLRAFPNLQFFATTHSPFVVQSLFEGSLLNLDNMDSDDEVYNLDLVDIIEEIQNVEVPERSDVHVQQVESATRFLKLARAASDTTDTASRAAYDNEMDRILDREIEDPGLAAILKIKRHIATES
ncbi:AAA family ATPase [Pelagibius sp.]|uniref:AAA family ATPase n=1 Tax=Pelagibius sp. TaxID=1931238 RepID=UPI0026060E75|nr:AAA family ATPase [Pelagibius sp.]